MKIPQYDFVFKIPTRIHSLDCTFRFRNSDRRVCVGCMEQQPEQQVFSEQKLQSAFISLANPTVLSSAQTPQQAGYNM